MTYRLIAVDGNGCHSFIVDVSEKRYHRPKYMEALYNSIEMVFKKLKYHKGKMDITITEVIINESTKETPTIKQKRAKAPIQAGEARPTLGPSRSEGIKLAGSKAGIQTYQVTDKPRNK